jgi:ribosome-binding ATPase
LEKMDAGIISLQKEAKSTVWDAISVSLGAQSANHPFHKIEARKQIAIIPNGRLERIALIMIRAANFARKVQAGRYGGGRLKSFERHGLGNLKSLNRFRKVDGILQVVRCLDDPDVTSILSNFDPV